METEILIVGAGPSGAAAAVQLGQLGIKDVLLVDRDRFPRDKTCGSGLSPTALHVAEALGIGPELRERANPVLTVRIVTPAGDELRVPANSAAVILLRKEFDGLLVERARSLGVRFRDGYRVTEAIEENGRVVGVRGLEGSEIRARWTLFADGAHSLFTRDDRERRHIDTLMGWWEGPEFEPGRLDMVFDRELHAALRLAVPGDGDAGEHRHLHRRPGRVRAEGAAATCGRCSRASWTGTTGSSSRGRGRSAGGRATPSSTPPGSPT